MYYIYIVCVYTQTNEPRSWTLAQLSGTNQKDEDWPAKMCFVRNESTRMKKNSSGEWFYCLKATVRGLAVYWFHQKKNWEWIVQYVDMEIWINNENRWEYFPCSHGFIDKSDTCWQQYLGTYNWLTNMRVSLHPTIHLVIACAATWEVSLQLWFAAVEVGILGIWQYGPTYWSIWYIYIYWIWYTYIYIHIGVYIGVYIHENHWKSPNISPFFSMISPFFLDHRGQETPSWLRHHGSTGLRRQTTRGRHLGHEEFHGKMLKKCWKNGDFMELNQQKLWFHGT